MILTREQIESQMQTPGQRSLIVSDTDDLLFEPSGLYTIRIDNETTLAKVLVDLENADVQKKRSYKVNERGIESVVIGKVIKTRNMQKLYQLQKLRHQRRVLKIALVEQTENLQNINGTHDNDVDMIALNLRHDEFTDQVRRIKQRMFRGKYADMTEKLDKCLSDECVDDARMMRGWLIVNFTEQICAIDYQKDLTASAEVNNLADIYDALDTACEEQEEEAVDMQVEENNNDYPAEIDCAESDLAEGYICTSCGNAICVQEEGEEEESTSSESESYTYSYSISEGESETIEDSYEESEEDVESEEEVESDDYESSEESEQEEEKSESEESDGSEEAESDDASEESSDEENNVQVISKEMIALNPVYSPIEKSADDIAYEMAMEKIDSLIDQLQKTRAAAKLAKESKQLGWLSWLWTK